MVLFFPVFQDVSWGTFEYVAYSVERRKPDSLRLPCFKNREVGWRYTDFLRKLVKRHFALCHHNIQIYDNHSLDS